MAKAIRRLGRAARVPREIEVCERHLGERPGKCEGLVYVAKGAEARAVSTNVTCTRCRRPLARILDAIAKVKRRGACDFCYKTARPVAVARESFLGVAMKICQGCASDAAHALKLARHDDAEPEPDDEAE